MQIIVNQFSEFYVLGQPRHFNDSRLQNINSYQIVANNYYKQVLNLTNQCFIKQYMVLSIAINIEQLQNTITLIYTLQHISRLI